MSLPDSARQRSPSDDLVLDVAIDPSADPADWDDALATFLLAFVRKQAASAVDTASAGPVVLSLTSADERHQA